MSYDNNPQLLLKQLMRLCGFVWGFLPVHRKPARLLRMPARL
jgi:hypothetical protein